MSRCCGIGEVTVAIGRIAPTTQNPCVCLALWGSLAAGAESRGGRVLIQGEPPTPGVGADRPEPVGYRLLRRREVPTHGVWGNWQPDGFWFR